MNISFKEANETRYWLLLFEKAGFIKEDRLHLLDDIDEINKILVKIIKSSNEHQIEKKEKK